MDSIFDGQGSIITYSPLDCTSVVRIFASPGFSVRLAPSKTFQTIWISHFSIVQIFLKMENLFGEESGEFLSYHLRLMSPS